MWLEKIWDFSYEINLMTSGKKKKRKKIAHRFKGLKTDLPKYLRQLEHSMVVLNLKLITKKQCCLIQWIHACLRFGNQTFVQAEIHLLQLIIYLI